MFDNVNGRYDILFVDKTDYIKVDIHHVQLTIRGDIVCIVDNSGAIYNWNNILVMRKARR